MRGFSISPDDQVVVVDEFGHFLRPLLDVEQHGLGARVLVRLQGCNSIDIFCGNLSQSLPQEMFEVDKYVN